MVSVMSSKKSYAGHMVQNKWLLFLFFMLTAGWCICSPHIPNVLSRMGLAHSLTLGGAPTIDNIAIIEIDRAHFGNHYYSDKAPGVSILSVPGIAIAQLALKPFHVDPKLLSDDQMHTTLRYLIVSMAALIFVLIPLSAAGVVAFRQAALDAGVVERIANPVTLVFAFGTPYLIWSALAFGHATSASLLICGFAQYWALAAGTARPRVRIAAAGFLLAFAVVVEFIAAPASIAIGILIATQVWRAQGTAGVVRRLGLLALGGILPAVILMAYNTAAFGSPFHLGYSEVDGWAGMQQGFFGISVPRLSVLWQITFGAYRGIFWLSPVLLPALYGCLTLLGRPQYRATAITALVITASYFLINAGYFYWDGGRTTGPRHVTPALAFLMFGLCLAYGTFPRWLRIVTIVTGTYSVLVVVLCAVIEKRAFDVGHPPMLAVVWNAIQHGEADTIFAHHLLPFPVVVAVPFVLVGGLAWIILRDSRTGRDAAPPLPA